MTQLKIMSNYRQSVNLYNVLSQQTTMQRSLYSTTVKAQTWKEAKPYSAIPRTSTWEFLRGLMPGGKFYKKDLNELVLLMHKEKGPILVLPGALGTIDKVLTQNPDDFEIVFRRDGVWPERLGFELLTYHREVQRKEYFSGISGLLTTQGKAWGEFRTAVNPIIIHPKNVKVYLPMMSKVNEEFIERIKAIRDPKTLEVPENFKDEISYWTLESVGVVALDKQLGLITGKNPVAKRFFDNIQQFLDLSVDLEIKPSLWRQLPNRKFNKCMALLDDLCNITEHYINESLERIEKLPADRPESEKSVLEKLVKINKKIATTMAMDMMFAGVDTTTSTFTGLLLCLAKNPEKQQKLREEILKLLPEKDSPLTEENMKNLPYLRACLKESLRIYPITAGNVRTIHEDMVLSGFQIPKGVEVGMLNLELLLDPTHYTDPKDFIPERWLRQNQTDKEENCPHAAASKSSHPFVYLPFGFGPRSCIGRRIAEMELEIGIARVIRNFNVEFNHSTEKAFKATQLSVPAIPLKFKFTDLAD